MSEDEVRPEVIRIMDARAADGVPYLCLGAVSALCGASDDVVLPLDGDRHDWELELAAVIGRGGRRRGDEGTALALDWCVCGVRGGGFSARVRRVAGVRRKVSAIRTEFVEPLIAELATRQHGVVARRQLAELGLRPTAIARRVDAGRLHRIHRGVYSVGHRVLGPRGRWMAAVLACGEGAALSHRSAGALWEIRFSSARLTDVSVPRPGGQKRPGLRIHRAASLRSEEVTVTDGIPVTTPARTVLDLAAVLDERPLQRLLDRTELLELTDYPTLDALARAHATHRGATTLRRALKTHHAGTTLTKGQLEERFLALCREHGLPTPLVNTWPEGKEVDFRFPGHTLIVETDGWTHHRSREAFEHDRARDAHHARAGYRTLRFTHRQLVAQPATVAATIAATLIPTERAA